MAVNDGSLHNPAVPVSRGVTADDADPNGKPPTPSVHRTRAAASVKLGVGRCVAVPVTLAFGGGGCVVAFFRRLLQRLFGRPRSPVAPFARFMDPEGAKRPGYDATPIGRQWPPSPRRPVDKSGWKFCHACGRLTPVVRDQGRRVAEVRTAGQRTHDPDGTIIEEGVTYPIYTAESAGAWTYVCPFCGHGHVGTPSDHPDLRAQATCHECGTDLNAAPRCPKCSFPRGWMTVRCPHCSNRQPIYVPHWVVHCDMFTLECVKCESAFDSHCIC